ncbi:BrnA antitoxin family protein [Treponema pedis]|uniref:BrnA antitoxin family protein n=1 Tax=Treponema pedis TaxID=409322 RepID=UPI003D1DBA24
MSTIKTMSLDEVAKYEIPAEDLERLNGFKNTDFSDCPKDTPAQLALYKPWYKVHPNGYGKAKTLAQGGEDYQARLNAVLRWAKQNGCPIAAFGRI